MVPHRRAILLLLALPIAMYAACDKVPLLAPTGTVITILPAANTVSLNSQIPIVATAIQNGVASSGAGSGVTTTTTSTGGTAVQNGTLISFTTTIGSIQPQEARTHDGQVSVSLVTGNESGTATITAYSGGASSSVQLKVGTAAATTITVSATPASLGPAGGTTQVIALVTDTGGGPIAGVPVTFTTDKGTLSPSTATTDANGNATVTLNTTATANVTATAGGVSGKVAVNVNVRGLTSFTASPTATSTGTPVTFTVTPASGANISSVHIDFGDGTSTDLGAIGAATTVPHIYNASGTYTATATASDGSSLSTQVVIGSLPITLTASPSPATEGDPVTLTVGGLGSAQVASYVWTYDDGTGSHTTSGPQDTHTFTSRGLKTVRVDVIAINGSQIGSATTSLTVQ
jgi:adhesin/invasin